MAKQQKDVSPLSAFDDVISNLSGKIDSVGEVVTIDNDDDDDIPLSEIDDAHNDGEKEPLEKDDSKTDSINDDVDNDDDSKEGDNNNNNAQELNIDDQESEQVTLFFDAFSEALGWESEDDKKPKSIDGLIDYMQNLIDDNSEPEYSNDQVRELDEYVRNGGKFEDYLKNVESISSLDNIDITSETNQKRIIREHLKLSGSSDSTIDRKLARWEDAGVLEEEAEESLEFLKEHKKKENEAMLEKQAKMREEQERAQVEFYNNTISEIDKLSEVRGIKIPADDRKKLKDYAFKVEADGTTKYQKDFQKNLSKNFIESAYLLMKGDSLVKSARKTGETSALSRLRESMKNRTPGRSKYEMNNDSATPIWEMASKTFGVRS